MKYLTVFILFIFTSLSLWSQESETIHVMVALCDNKYQGIVKVPKAIGNGQDPNNNLYWGCGFGVRTYFKKSKDWKEIKRYQVDSICLERIVFKHKTHNFYLVADAYDGRYIKQCTIDFLSSNAGRKKDSLLVDGEIIGIYGNSKVLTYIGHNGLMDFDLLDTYDNRDGETREAIILACASRQYFKPYLTSAKSNPLLWTTHFMAPEAYTLHDALNSYIKGEGDNAVWNSGAATYAKYQKCSLKAAKRLIVTGY